MSSCVQVRGCAAVEFDELPKSSVPKKAGADLSAAVERPACPQFASISTALDTAQLTASL